MVEYCLCFHLMQVALLLSMLFKGYFSIHLIDDIEDLISSDSGATTLCWGGINKVPEYFHKPLHSNCANSQTIFYFYTAKFIILEV